MGEKKINNMNYLYNNYFKNIGELIRKIKNSYIIFKSKEEKICFSCNKENNIKDNYCKFCGNEFYEIVLLRLFEIKLDLKFKIKEFLYYVNKRGVFLIIFIIIFILFIIVLIFKVIIII